MTFSTHSPLFHAVQQPSGNATLTLLTLLLIYLYRLANYTPISVKLALDHTHSLPAWADAFYTYTVPLTTAFTPCMSFKKSLLCLSQKIHQLQNNAPFSTDMSSRYHALSNKWEEKCGVIHMHAPPPHKPTLPRQTLFSAYITEDEHKCTCALHLFVSPQCRDTVLPHIETHLKKCENDLKKSPNKRIDRIQLLSKVDRKKHQVKIQGYRIEPKSIEAWVNRHPCVQQCVVSVCQDTHGDAYLAAYFTPQPHSSLPVDEKALHHYLSQRLPRYMLPRTFMQIPQMPLDLNGKIDKSFLPKPTYKLNLSQKKFYPARTHTEKKLTALWQDILHVADISIQDDFFDLGGNSLLLTRLISHVNTLFNTNIRFNTFIQSPTIGALSKIIDHPQSHSDRDCSQKVFIEDAKYIHPLLNTYPPKKIAAYSPAFSHVLVTGATGYLGRQLVGCLQRLTTTHCYCLVRHIEKAKQVLVRHVDLSRITFIKGDLSHPYLGLTRTQFFSLTHCVDAIYHVGAYVHHLYDYRRLRTTNVLSIAALVEFALHAKCKPIYAVSTLLIQHTPPDTYAVVAEHFLKKNATCTLDNGYMQTNGKKNTKYQIR